MPPDRPVYLKGPFSCDVPAAATLLAPILLGLAPNRVGEVTHAVSGDRPRTLCRDHFRYYRACADSDQYGRGRPCHLFLAVLPGCLAAGLLLPLRLHAATRLCAPGRSRASGGSHQAPSDPFAAMLATLRADVCRDVHRCRPAVHLFHPLRAVPRRYAVHGYPEILFDAASGRTAARACQRDAGYRAAGGDGRAGAALLPADLETATLPRLCGFGNPLSLPLWRAVSRPYRPVRDPWSRLCRVRHDARPAVAGASVTGIPAVRTGLDPPPRLRRLVRRHGALAHPRQLQYRPAGSARPSAQHQPSTLSAVRLHGRGALRGSLHGHPPLVGHGHEILLDDLRADEPVHLLLRQYPALCHPPLGSRCAGRSVPFRLVVCCGPVTERCLCKVSRLELHPEIASSVCAGLSLGGR